MSSASGKKLTDLRVCDLKDELEKRSLEITGNKTVLVERLQKALKDEGEDPETYIFETGVKRTTPAKRTPVKIKTEEPEPEEDIPDDSSDVVIVDEVGTVDGEGDEGDENHEGETNDNEESINLTIEEEEQNLLHDEDQEGKDEEAIAEDGNAGTSIGKNLVIKIKQEVLDEAEEENENTEQAEAGEEGAAKEAEAAEDETPETAVAEENNEDSGQKSPAKTTTPSNKEEKDNAAAEGAVAAAAAIKKTASTSSRNLWVSGLSSLTRASDLKTIFSKYGKVIGAKVVTNTKTPGTRCYGYVTMGSSTDASSCIEHLHRTELHGRIISVERTKSEIGSASSANKKDDKTKQATCDNGEAKEAANGPVAESKGSGANASEKAVSIDRKKSEADRSRKNSRARSDRKPIRSISRGQRRSPIRRGRRSLDRDRDNRPRDVLSFQKIREERERQRMRERERELREADRRRREIRRRQREEEERLTREREKLRLERERLEREKAELLRLERERQKLEREKIELERLELKRQQMKILQRNEESKRSLKRPGTDDRYGSGHSDAKRSNADRRFEAPPPPRFDSSLARSSDKKRDDYTSSKRDDYKRDVEPSRHSSSSYRSSRDGHKDSRYSVPDPPRSSGFRRDDRDSRNSGSKRFESSSYSERTNVGSSGGGSSGSGWHNSGPPAIKSFAASQMTNNPSWQSKSSESSASHWPSTDRYDRTYNERSGPSYMDPPRMSGMFVGGAGGRPQDRYGGQLSRYENGKY